MLLGTASPMRSTALGRHVLKTHQLDEQQHMGKYIAPGKKYPTPHAAFPVWDNNGKPAGAAMVELQSHHQNKALSWTVNIDWWQMNEPSLSDSSVPVMAKPVSRPV